MADIRFEVYTFSIHELNKSAALPVQNFDGTDSFYDFFYKYTQSLKSDIYVNEEQKKSVQFNPSHLRPYKSAFAITGVIQSGDYGIESDIVDSQTKKRVFKKEKHHLDVKPFYFLVCSPENLKLGILILQRTGIFGIHSVFTSHVAQSFKEEHPGYRIKFSTYIAKNLGKDLLTRGTINEITFIRKSLPKDIADKLGVVDLANEIQRIEFRIIAKRKRMFNNNNQLKKFAENPDTALFEIPELENIGFDNSEQTEKKLRVQIGKTSRTINIGDAGKLRPYYDIADELEYDITGHPTFKSIDKAGTTYLQDILDDLKTNA